MDHVAETKTAQAAVAIAYLPIASIRLDGGTQSRVGLDADHVDDLAAVLRAGGSLPPVDVYHDGAAHWLADGFHRVEAYAEAGREKVPATVHQGTKRDAILHSVGANATHGLRRSNDDKRRAVEVLLRDEEWQKWSDRKIAEVCGVGNKFVGDVRRELCPEHSSPPGPKVRKGADGKTRKVPAPKAKRQLHPKVIAKSTKATTTTVEATDETPPAAAPVLSERDQKIGELYRASRTTKEIAKELGLSVSVVQAAKGRLGFVRREPNPLHGLIFNVECQASTLLSSVAYVLEEKPAAEEHIQEAVAALDKLAAAVARAKARLLAGTFGEDDEDEDEREATP